MNTKFGISSSLTVWCHANFVVWRVQAVWQALYNVGHHNNFSIWLVRTKNTELYIFLKYIKKVVYSNTAASSTSHVTLLVLAASWHEMRCSTVYSRYIVRCVRAWYIRSTTFLQYGNVGVAQFSFQDKMHAIAQVAKARKHLKRPEVNLLHVVLTIGAGRKSRRKSGNGMLIP